jgi:TonB family protein
MEEHAYKRDFSGLFCALLFSAGLHLLLFWPALRPGSHAASAPLSATLMTRAGAPSFQPVAPIPILTTPRAATPLHEAAQASSAPVPAVQTSAPVLPSASLATQVQAASSGVDAGGLRQYRVSLAVMIQRMGLLRQNLPAGVKGSLQVSVSVMPGGVVNQIAIDRSSGNTSLDQLALQAVKQAAAQMEAPAVLRGSAFVIDVPLEFGD